MNNKLVSDKLNSFLQRAKLLFTIVILRRKVTVLDILKYARENKSLGLCNSFECACIHYDVSHSYFLKVCDKFNNSEAVKFGAKPNRSSKQYWWDSLDWSTGRIKFLEYLIDYYSKQSPIYLPIP